MTTHKENLQSARGTVVPSRAACMVARVPWLAALTCAAVAVVHVFGLDDALKLLREDEVSGMLWKGWASALAHEGSLHFWLNALAAGVVLTWLELMNRKALAWVLVLAAPAGGLAAMLSFPPLGSYCGLSCVLHGVAGALAVELWRREGRAVGVLVVAALVCKLLSDFLCGSSLVLDPAQPLQVTTPSGHAAGLVVGFLVGLACRPRVAPCSEASVNAQPMISR